MAHPLVVLGTRQVSRPRRQDLALGVVSARGQHPRGHGRPPCFRRTSDQAICEGEMITS